MLFQLTLSTLGRTAEHIMRNVSQLYVQEKRVHLPVSHLSVLNHGEIQIAQQ